jgi:hypothetical protein
MNLDASLWRHQNKVGKNISLLNPILRLSKVLDICNTDFANQEPSKMLFSDYALLSAALTATMAE